MGAREPIERPPFGVSDSQDEHVLLVLFERDHVGGPLDGGPPAFARLFEFVRDHNVAGRQAGRRIFGLLNQFNDPCDVIDLRRPDADADIDALQAAEPVG